MPIYEYECESCGIRFERLQSMKEIPFTECPECGGRVHRLVSGGAGFIFKGAGQGRIGGHSDSCSLENLGRTCCGRNERCATPPCEGEG